MSGHIGSNCESVGENLQRASRFEALAKGIDTAIKLFIYLCVKIEYKK